MLFAFLCGCESLDRSLGCYSDTDCKGNRVCSVGECIENGTQVTQTTPSDTTVQTPQKKNCGQTVISCNCNQTQAYPGAVSQTSECTSGFQEFVVCGQCPAGGYAWYTNCKCW